MPRHNGHDRTKYLRPYPSKWNHRPTELQRYPAIFSEKMQAIARWADQQEDAVGAIEKLLAFTKQAMPAHGDAKQDT